MTSTVRTFVNTVLPPGLVPAAQRMMGEAGHLTWRIHREGNVEGRSVAAMLLVLDELAASVLQHATTDSTSGSREGAAEGKEAAAVGSKPPSAVFLEDVTRYGWRDRADGHEVLKWVNAVRPALQLRGEEPAGAAVAPPPHYTPYDARVVYDAVLLARLHPASLCHAWTQDADCDMVELLESRLRAAKDCTCTLQGATILRKLRKGLEKAARAWTYGSISEVF